MTNILLPANVLGVATAKSYIYAENSSGEFVRLDDSYVASADGTTTGDLLYVNAQGKIVNLPIGTSGQALTVSGGLPSWAAASGDSLALIQRQTASAAAAVDFTSGFSSSYDAYMFVFSDVYPSTNNTSIYIQYSLTGAAPFSNFGGGFANKSYFASAATLGHEGSLGGPLQLSASALNTAAGSHNGNVFVAVSATHCVCTSHLGYQSNVGDVVTYFSSGHATTATAVNAIRFLASSGNINGTISMYGVKNT